MKHNIWIIPAVLILAAVFTACGKSSNTGAGSLLGGENFDKDASYALGMSIGGSLAQDGIIPYLDEILQGMRDSINGNTRMPFDEAQMRFQIAYMAVMERKGIEAMEKETAFLAENSRKPGVIITGSGLQYEVISEGQGPKPVISDMVRVNYEGKLIDGTVFDSSYMRGMPAEFPLEYVISGWVEGIQLMSVGSKYKFYIPSGLAYGPENTGSIPAYSTLIFEVELLDIVK
jgi:FKBP-type peptidyl-prolyl cis-trans isomerase